MRTINNNSLFGAPRWYQENELGYYAAKHQVLSAYERLKNGEDPKEVGKNPLVDSRLRDAIYEWKEWQREHPENTNDKMKDSSLFALDDISLPVAHQYRESELGYYAAKYDVLSEYERIKCAREKGEDVVLDPLTDSRMRDAIYDWRKWKEENQKTMKIAPF